MDEERDNRREERRSRWGRALACGIRQRQAELAAGLGGSDAVRFQMLEVRSRALLAEPVCFSGRPTWGRLITALRKAFRRLFVGWYVRPWLEGQSRFQTTVAHLLEELAADCDALERRLARIEASCHRAEGGASPGRTGTCGS